MERVITATELARNLSDVLNRVRYTGERFVIARNGEPVALLSPAAPPGRITLRELAARLDGLPGPDDAFAADLEAIQAAQSPADPPAWPT